MNAPTTLTRLHRASALVNNFQANRWAVILVVAAGFIVLSSGYATHFPWSPDSPRFAAIARDMLATGDWLFPRVGGDLYADKPPVYFWLMAASIWLTGSVRAGYLLPSLVAGLGTLCLVFDLARRLWDTETALVAALTLLATVQFVLQAHTAQIDGVLCFFSTLGLYGLLRHLLLGPDWRWYAIGGAACGVGVITKGVGFLPLLVLLPWILLRRRGFLDGYGGTRLQWSSAPLAALAIVSLWLVPMVLSSLGDPALAAYRNEILFGQTVERYMDAGGHRKAFWYLFTHAVPWLWMPVSLVLPWLLPHWRDSWRRGDGKVVLPLAWALLVLTFFTLSTGKRGVYILPALPAIVLAAAPYLARVLRRRGPNYLALFAMLILGAAAALGFFEIPRLVVSAGVGLADSSMVASLRLASAVVAALAVVCVFPWPGRPVALNRFAALLAVTWIVIGWIVMPAIDDVRSGASIMATARGALPAGGQLGVTAPKESLVLHARGTLTNFGHRRPDLDQELADASLWLSGDPRRRLIVPDGVLHHCFTDEKALDLGVAHRYRWYLLDSSAVSRSCAARGHARNAIAYEAPLELPSLWRSAGTGIEQ